MASSGSPTTSPLSSSMSDDGDDHQDETPSAAGSSSSTSSTFYSDYFYLPSCRPYYQKQLSMMNSTNTNNNNTNGNSDDVNIEKKLNTTVHKYLTQRSFMKNNQYYEQVFKNQYLNELMTLTMEYSNKYKIKSCHYHDINGISINSNYLLSCGSDRKIGLYNYTPFLENDFDLMVDESNSFKYINRFNNNLHNYKNEIEACHVINKGESQHSSIISNIKWYPYDNGMFFTSSFDGQLIVWDTQTMSNVMNFDCMSKIYSFDIYGGNKIDPNQNIIACALDDHSIKLCDLNSGACVQQFIGHSEKVKSIQFSPLNDFIIASSSDDMTIRLWDIRTSGWLLSMDQFNIKTTSSNPKTNNTNNLNNSNVKNSSKLNNVKNRIEKRKEQSTKFSTSKSYNYSNIKVPTAHNQPINSIKFSKCGQYLYSSSNDNKLMKWITSNGKNTQFNCNITNRNKGSCEIIEESEGDILFHASFNRIELFDKFNSRKIKHLSEIHYDSIKSLKLDSKNQFLFSCGSDQFIEVWDTNLNLIYDTDYGNDENVIYGKRNENIENIQDQDDWD